MSPSWSRGCRAQRVCTLWCCWLWGATDLSPMSFTQTCCQPRGVLVSAGQKGSSFVVVWLSVQPGACWPLGELCPRQMCSSVRHQSPFGDWGLMQAPARVPAEGQREMRDGSVLQADGHPAH